MSADEYHVRSVKLLLSKDAIHNREVQNYFLYQTNHYFLQYFRKDVTQSIKDIQNKKIYFYIGFLLFNIFVILFLWIPFIVNNIRNYM